MGETEMEKYYLKEIERLRLKNDELRSDLLRARQQLLETAQKLQQVEEEKLQLEFTLSIKKFESSNTTQEDNELNGDQTSDETLTSFESESLKTDQRGSQLIPISSEDGFEIPARLRTLHTLAMQYAAQGRYDVAVPLCKQGLEDVKKTHGEDHLDTAALLNTLALIYKDQNKYPKTISVLQEALSIQKKALGESHPAIAATLNNLSVLFGKQGKFSEAEEPSLKALAIRRKFHGSNHLNVGKQLSNVALIYGNQGKYKEAQQYLEEALAIYESQLGPNDINVIKTKNSLASSYVKQGKPENAESLYKEVLTQSYEHLRGNENGDSKPIWKWAEEIEKSEKGTDEGKPFTLNEDCYAWLKAVESNEPIMLAVMKNLGVLYKKQERNKAAKFIDECIQYLKQ